MKLLSLRLLKVYPSKSLKIIDSIGYSLNFNVNVHSSSHLKCARKCWTMTRYQQTTNNFRYEYDSEELLEKSKSSSTDNTSKIKALLRTLKSQNAQSQEELQAIVSSIILAAKDGQNVENAVQKTFGANAIVKFTALCDTWLDQMNADDAVSTLIALNLLKIPLHHPVNRKLTTCVTNMLRGEFEWKSEWQSEHMNLMLCFPLQRPMSSR